MKKIITLTLVMLLSYIGVQAQTTTNATVEKATVYLSGATLTQTATATLKLNPSSFEFFDTETNTMLTKAGRYELLYGNNSQDSHLQRMEITLQ